MHEPIWDKEAVDGPGGPSEQTVGPPLFLRTMEKQSARIVVSNSLKVSNNDELAVLLQQPASKFGQGDPRDLIQIRPPALCSVCYNLDPYEAPKDRSGEDDKWAWAPSEYVLPPGTPVAKITVTKSAELLESAQRGCLTCTMIAAALSGVSPGWEEGQSFMHLLLAPNLPLVVRLHPGGSTKSWTAGREAFRDLGVLRPEGSTLTWNIEISVSKDKVEQKLEIEIYRRNIAREQSTVGGIFLPPFPHPNHALSKLLLTTARSQSSSSAS